MIAEPPAIPTADAVELSVYRRTPTPPGPGELSMSAVVASMTLLLAVRRVAPPEQGRS
jgi:hypothetical protein